MIKSYSPWSCVAISRDHEGSTWWINTECLQWTRHLHFMDLWFPICSSQYSRMPFQYITWIITGTEAENQSDAGSSKTPHCTKEEFTHCNNFTDWNVILSVFFYISFPCSVIRRRVMKILHIFLWDYCFNTAGWSIDTWLLVILCKRCFVSNAVLLFGTSIFPEEILKWVARNSFSTTASFSGQPRWLLYWYWCVAETFCTPPYVVILLQSKASKNGTSWDLVAI